MIHFYHPNKSIKGSAASFWYSSRNNSVFATIMKQSGWDEKNDNGVFRDESPAMKVSIKLSQTEIAAILDCIERKNPFKTHHDFGEKPKNISFVPSFDKMDATRQIGYDFSFLVLDKQDSTKKDSFFIRFTLAEARLIRELLIHFLHKQFDNVNKSPEIRSTNNSEKNIESAPKETEEPDDGILADL
jgi:hypothetical protein